MLDIKHLKNIREDNDLSQQEIAKILNVSRSTYSLWELGINIIPLSNLYKIANYFDTSIDYLLGKRRKKNTRSNNHLDLVLLGYNIKKCRIENNISQENLATLLNVSQPCIARYEKGLIEISTINIYKLSKIFNISIDDLIDKTLETQKITEKI